ncbi:MAG: hypothetical protein CVU11_02445 [Bacteroidetes bacterium HGW-Bacteroidetes-6]|nr:MAG: hypothetical protein CVU11_02445 [Bacteroidetes bacterium HGW-Bacteroidetes-6]
MSHICSNKLFMRSILFVAALLIFSVSYSQTVVWSEDFSTGGTGWTISSTEGSNDAAHNIWIVNTLGPTGSSPSGGNLLHVTCNSSDGFCSVMGGPGSVYNAGGITAITTHVVSYSPNINTTGWSNMTLKFWYQSRGQIGVDYGTVRYSTDGGSNWTSFSTQFATQSSWSEYSIALPVSCENISNLRIGFSWQNNNDAIGNDPPFCVDDIQITIPTVTGPDAAFTASSTNICAGDCIAFSDQSSGNIASWLWNFPGATPSSSGSQYPGNICYHVAGNYKAYLTVTDQSNATSVDSLSIQVNSVTPAAITANPTQGPVPLLVQFSTIAPALECNWLIDAIPYNSVSLVNYSFLTSGNYQACLYTQNANGCKDTACLNIVALDVFPLDTSFINVPNVFTPNGDLKNDVFTTSSQNIVKWNTKIYNRWGNVMFETEKPDVQWDGNSAGKPAADGVYYFVINATGSDGKKYELAGNITLMR